MKKLSTLILVVLFITTGFAQENNKNKPGKNFSLEGALALFKNAKSLEEFEKSINEEKNNVNNLDLDKNGKIDYVVVSDIKENNAHVIVLSTYLSESEKQDIATIGIEKTGNEEAQLQIEGDKALYAANTIVEPIDIQEKAANTNSPSNFEITLTPIIVNVWFWPSVQYLYAPNYVVWVSPYRFGYYPIWWKPWNPFSYVVFYSSCAPYRVYYHTTTTRRVVVAQGVYLPKRSYSTVVVRNNSTKTTVVRNYPRNTTVIRRNNNARVVKVNR